MNQEYIVGRINDLDIEAKSGWLRVADLEAQLEWIKMNMCEDCLFQIGKMEERFCGKKVYVNSGQGNRNSRKKIRKGK